MRMLGNEEVLLAYIQGLVDNYDDLTKVCNVHENSHKRLVPGFEAPVTMVYSEGNRSAGIRIPHVTNDKEKRIEARFPDALANPYLAFAALLMAGLDGIKNKMHPGEAMDKDLYDLPPEEVKGIPTVCASLQEALAALQFDHDFLLQGDVFSTDLIEAYIKLKQREITRLAMTPHPLEFDEYYSV